MRATLIYNPRAGTALSRNDLVSELGNIGWTVQRSMEKGDFDSSCCRGSDVVVVAGGDGTFASVARTLAGSGMPMAFIPMGTANNVARSLGIGVDPTLALKGLEDVVERHIDLGNARGGASFDGLFTEGLSVGIFADVLAEKVEGKKSKRLRKALRVIADELESYSPRRFEIEIEGCDYSDQFVLAAVMNVRSLGPAVNLAPEAKCDDGRLDVVLVRPEAKASLLSHLRRAAEEGDIVLPSFETVAATRVLLAPHGHQVQIDDRSSAHQGRLDVEVAAGVLTLLAPAVSAPRSA